MRLLQCALLGVFGAAAVVHGADCVGINGIRPECTSVETPYRRDVFFVGGKYVPYGNTTQSITSGQVYVEKLTPLAGVNQTYPLVFVTAGIPSGAVRSDTFQLRVDGR